MELMIRAGIVAADERDLYRPGQEKSVRTISVPHAMSVDQLVERANRLREKRP